MSQLKIINSTGKKISAQELYSMLIKAWIKNASGSITANFLGISVRIKEKSAMGDIIQEWLSEWMLKNNISFWVNENSQTFPDFYLDIDSDKNSLLEVKTFDISRWANFDIANFDAYVRSLPKQPYRIDANYLILGYRLDQWNLSIADIWLANIWEITCKSERFALKTQVKQNKVYNIRPANWHSKKSKFKPFQTAEEFISAVQDTLNAYYRDNLHASWSLDFKKAYLEHYGKPFGITGSATETVPFK